MQNHTAPHTGDTHVHRRGILRSVLVAAAAALGFSRLVTQARAQTKHIRLYV